MHVHRNGSSPSRPGSAASFAGAVRVDWRFQPDEGRAGCALLTFEPGARTAWHAHPLGQTLIVSAGVGWAQCEGEPKVEISAGDLVWFRPGERHWHGATATTAMSHIAVTEMLDGAAVQWMEHVSDDHYLGSGG